MQVRTAIVVEGGAMRGIFSAGVLDRLQEEGLTDFDLALGTSAGAANLASFVAGQHERNLRCYTQIMVRKELFSWPRFLKGGHFMDLDWLWDTFAAEQPLDEAAVNRSRTQLMSTATCFESGKALYHPQRGAVHEGVKGGCALPVLYRGPIYLHGAPIVDGGVSDPIPVRHAYECGARRIVVVRSRPAAVQKTRSAVDGLAAALAFRRPALARALLNSAKRYADALTFLQSPPEDLQLVQVAPPAPMGTSRTTQDVATLMTDYRCGRTQAERTLTEITGLLR